MYLVTKMGESRTVYTHESRIVKEIGVVKDRRDEVKKVISSISKPLVIGAYVIEKVEFDDRL